MKLPLYTWILLVIIAVTGWVVTDLLAGETPHGRFAGTLLAADTGEALRNIAVNASPKASSKRSYRATTDGQGRFLFPHLPVGAYTLTTETQAHQQPAQGITIREGDVASAIFELQPTEPFLRIFQRQRVFTTREEPKLRVHGFAPAGEVSAQVYRVAPETVQENQGGLSANSMTLNGRDLDFVNLDTVPQLTRVSLPPSKEKIAITAKDRDGEGVFRKELSAGKLPPGTYLIALEAAGLRELSPVVVTDLGLIVKAAPGQMLAYAVDIDSGEAIAGAHLQARWNGKEVGKSRTGADGLAGMALPKSEDGGELVVIGSAGESQAITHLYSYWYEGDSPLRAYTYTDRPVYRPGHKVGFKSILRELKGNDYRVPAKEAVSVRVTDERDNLVHAGRYTTSDFGSLSGSFALSEDALPGSYTVTVNARGGHYSDYFSVAEYRKPEYEVDIVTPKKRYHRGQAIPATITARYYYGAPVPNAQVEYYVTRSQYWYYGENDEWDEDITEPEYNEGEEVIYGTGNTNASGMLSITIPAKEVKGKSEGQDWRYTIYAMVTDAGERMQDGQSSVLVTHGEFRLEARPEDWVAQPEQPVAVNIRAVDYDGKPVAGARGSAVFARVRWDNDRERLLEPVKQSWRADADGRATITVTPKRDGDYRLTVTAKDGKGNLITDSAGVWVMSDSYASFDYPYQDIDIRADRDLYQEGDTAQIVVNTRYAPITALLTIEGPNLLEQRLVKLEGKSTVLPVRISPEFMPSVRAGICFVKGKKFYSGEAPINVSRDKKALQVVVTSDKAKYGPGEEAVYRVKTLAPDGKPVQAEVSLGLVDEAIYGIAPESAENIVSYFYPKRAHEVYTAFSFPEIYLSGDNKAGSEIRTRRRFLDTAFWNPTTVTDQQGEATFTLTLPDNLTTWRATCRAATRDTRVGQAIAKAAVSMPFSVRLEPPRFLVQGDRVQLASVSHNLSGSDLSTQFGLNVTGLRLRGSPDRAGRIGNGKTERTEWDAEVLDPGMATVRAWAKGGRLDDAMELTLPILPRGRERVEAYQGAVEGMESRVFSINEACIPGTQAMTMRLTPSLASAMLGSLDYLANYPYGCVEQTMSSFLPDVVIKEMLDTLKIENPELRKELPKMVQAGLLKLYAMQHDDGGWGWWEYDETDPWMTAYVIYGLAKARRAGFSVNPSVMENGITALKRQAGTKPEMAGFVALALAEAGQRKSAEALVNEYLGSQGSYRLSGLNDWNRLMLAQAMALVDKEDNGREIVTAMWRNYHQLGTDPLGYSDWWSENDFDAALLSAAMSLTPDDPRLSELVRKLMARRQNGHWYSTRDTAFILYGLSRYLLHTRELEPDMTVKVLLNGKQVAARRFTGEDIFQPEFTLKLEAKDLTGNKPKLEIVKEGRGQLYYSASLTQSVELALEQKVAATDLRVERAYRKVRRDLARRGTADTAGSRPQMAFRNGDIIEVTLTVRSQRGYEYLMLEDMLPAGCEVLDRGKVSRWEWNDWWCGEIVRDEMMGFPLRSLNPGVRRIKYYLVAQVPGVFTALPPRVYDMYRPDWRGEGVGQVITIR